MTATTAEIRTATETRVLTVKRAATVAIIGYSPVNGRLLTNLSKDAKSARAYVNGWAATGVVGIRVLPIVDGVADATL